MSHRGFEKGSDTGLFTEVSHRTKRNINPDGSFNIVRKGEIFSEDGIFHQLVNMPIFSFLSLIFGFYFGINLLFSFGYYLLGPSAFQGVGNHQGWDFFWDVYFFGLQTITTVGYGSVAPTDHWASALAGIEALSGILTFALATGLLYGRFSKPRAKILFSEKAIIGKYQQNDAFMVKIANGRKNVLTDLEASVIIKFSTKEKKYYRQQFHVLKLELQKINFMPLNWTLVHVITEQSPLYQKTKEDLAQMDAEIMVYVKGFDDSYHQMIQAKTSYVCGEIVHHASFVPSYRTDEDGNVIFYPDRISEIEIHDEE
jgi:inward rectifier potassium channel